MLRFLEPTHRANRALVGVKNNGGIATLGRAFVHAQPKLFFFGRAKLQIATRGNGRDGRTTAQVVQRTVHQEPTAVVHKHHHHRTFLKSGLVMLLALKLNAIANVVFAVQLRFGAHELAVRRQIEVGFQRRR